MNIFARIIIKFVLLFFISTAVLGQTNTVIAYANGVNTEYQSGKISLAILKKRVKERFSSDEFSQVEFHLSHNPTDGYIKDIFESAFQSFQLKASDYYRFLSGIDILPDSLQQAYIDGALAIDEFALQNDDVQRHVDFYKQAISQNKRVIIVPHSQGNFFASLSYNNLSPQEQDKVGIVSVANVGGFPADGRLIYTTSAADVVVDALFIAALGNSIPSLSLTPNVANPFSLKEPTGHFFIGSYLKVGNPSQIKILDDIWATFYNLPFPSPVRYLRFIEGNPGVVGDGVFISGTPFYQPPEFYPLYEFRVSSDDQMVSPNNGITVSIFTDLPPSDILFSITFSARSVSCPISFAGGIPDSFPRVNGVRGVAFYFSRVLLDIVTVLCHTHLNDLYVRSFAVDTGSDRTLRLDAIALGEGEGAVP